VDTVQSTDQKLKAVENDNATLTLRNLQNRAQKRGAPKTLRASYSVSFSDRTFEAWQPDPGARPRYEVRVSNQGSQSTRSGIGLVHRRLVMAVLGVVIGLQRGLVYEVQAPRSGGSTLGSQGPRPKW